MSGARDKAFTPNDPDFAAVFAAVTMILSCAKPKRRRKMVADLRTAAIVLPDTAVVRTAACKRASACLAEAVKRWSESNGVS